MSITTAGQEAKLVKEKDQAEDLLIEQTTE
jgi:hypothetical protein